MNAETPALRAALAFGKNMGEVAERRIASPVHEFFEAELCTDVEKFAAWIECARTDRQHSTRFPQPISNAELHALQYGKNTTMLMRALACEELRLRFLAEHADEINTNVSREKAREEQRAAHRADTPL